MPNTAAAKKDLRQSVKRRVHNRAVRADLRTSIRRVREALSSGDAEAAGKALSAAVSKLDKAAKRRILHPRTASRYQSRLAKRINAIKQS